MARREEWRAVAGYEGAYEVSDRGRVRSLERLSAEHYHPQTGIRRRRVQGRVLAVLRHPSGYLRVDLYDESGEQRSLYVHRLVASAFVPKPARDVEVNHINGRRDCNRASNLQWATKKENQSHACYVLRGGRGPVRGEQHGHAKLTERAVRTIRRSKCNRRTLAKRYGVCQATIDFVVNRRTWRHVT